jgi:hypothetical protein
VAAAISAARQRLLRHLDVRGVDQHAVHAHRTATLGLRLAVGSDIALCDCDFVGGRRIHLVGDGHLGRVDRPLARVAEQGGASGVALVADTVALVTPAADRVAPSRVLDLDHVGAELGQVCRGQGRGSQGREIKHPHAIEHRGGG